jgi:Major Facilitator Superfamily
MFPKETARTVHSTIPISATSGLSPDHGLESSSNDIEAPNQIPSCHGEDEEPYEYPGLAAIIPITICLCLCVFVVALDRLIVATAIPRITDEFHSLGDIGWYGSSYLLTSASFQLLYGRLFTFYDTKWVFMGALFTFTVGSALCGAAPSSTAFIIGRAIGGLGSSGVFRSVSTVFFDCGLY